MGGGFLTETPPDRDSRGHTPPDRDPLPWTETPLWTDRDPLDRDPPDKDPAPDSQTGSDIIQRPPLWTESQTGVKTLPCPKLYLRAVRRLANLADIPMLKFLRRVFLTTLINFKHGAIRHTESRKYVVQGPDNTGKTREGIIKMLLNCSDLFDLATFLKWLCFHYISIGECVWDDVYRINVCTHLFDTKLLLYSIPVEW